MDVHLGMQECRSVRRGMDYIFVERVSKGYFTHGKKRASDRWVAGMLDNEFLPGLAVCRPMTSSFWKELENIDFLTSLFAV